MTLEILELLPVLATRDTLFLQPECHKRLTSINASLTVPLYLQNSSKCTGLLLERVSQNVDSPGALH